jgi:hypothetical protein
MKFGMRAVAHDRTADKDVQAIAEKDPTMIVWWATEVECASAITRLQPNAALDQAAATQAFGRLKHLAHAWHEVDPSDPIREAAVRFLRVHPLGAADALQLAAAFIAAERRPSSLEVVTLDDRLAVAARKEGFVLIEVPSTEEPHWQSSVSIRESGAMAQTWTRPRSSRAHGKEVTVQISRLLHVHEIVLKEARASQRRSSGSF